MTAVHASATFRFIATKDWRVPIALPKIYETCRTRFRCDTAYRQLLPPIGVRTLPYAIFTYISHIVYAYKMRACDVCYCARVCCGPRLGHDSMCVHPCWEMQINSHVWMYITTKFVIIHQTHVRTWHDVILHDGRVLVVRWRLYSSSTLHNFLYFWGNDKFPMEGVFVVFLKGDRASKSSAFFTRLCTFIRSFGWRE